jgi:hypothetical protein
MKPGCAEMDDWGTRSRVAPVGSRMHDCLGVLGAKDVEERIGRRGVRRERLRVVVGEDLFEV